MPAPLSRLIRCTAKAHDLTVSQMIFKRGSCTLARAAARARKDLREWAKEEGYTRDDVEDALCRERNRISEQAMTDLRERGSLRRERGAAL